MENKKPKKLELEKLLLHMKAESYGLCDSIEHVDSIEIITPKKKFTYASEKNMEHICNRFSEIDFDLLTSISEELKDFRSSYYNKVWSSRFLIAPQQKTVRLKTKVKEVLSEGYPIWEWKDKNKRVISRNDALYILYEGNFIPCVASENNGRVNLYENDPLSPKANIEYFIKEIKNNDLIKSKKLKESLERKIKNCLNSKERDKGWSVEHSNKLWLLKHLKKDILYLKKYIQTYKLSDDNLKVLNLNRNWTNKFLKGLFEKFNWEKKNKALEELDFLIEEPLSLVISKNEQMKYLREIIKHY